VDFKPFEIVVVPFPFTDKVGAKRRPALIVSTSAFNRSHDQAVLAMITTAQQSDWPSDVHLEEWSAAGLSTACRVRLKLFTLDRELILRRVGTLAPHDRMAVQTALSQCIAVV
jgi:mRNA interferase MazF